MVARLVDTTVRGVHEPCLGPVHVMRCLMLAWNDLCYPAARPSLLRW